MKLKQIISNILVVIYGCSVIGVIVLFIILLSPRISDWIYSLPQDTQNDMLIVSVLFIIALLSGNLVKAIENWR